MKASKGSKIVTSDLKGKGGIVTSPKKVTLGTEKGKKFSFVGPDKSGGGWCGK